MALRDMFSEAERRVGMMSALDELGFNMENDGPGGRNIPIKDICRHELEMFGLVDENGFNRARAEEFLSLFPESVDSRMARNMNMCDYVNNNLIDYMESYGQTLNEDDKARISGTLSLATKDGVAWMLEDESRFDAIFNDGTFYSPSVYFSDSDFDDYRIARENNFSFDYADADFVAPFEDASSTMMDRGLSEEGKEKFGLIQGMDNLGFDFSNAENQGLSVSLDELYSREYTMLGLIGESGLNASRVQYLAETPFEEMDANTQNMLSTISYMNEHVVSYVEANGQSLSPEQKATIKDAFSLMTPEGFALGEENRQFFNDKFFDYEHQMEDMNVSIDFASTDILGYNAAKQSGMAFDFASGVEYENPSNVVTSNSYDFPEEMPEFPEIPTVSDVSIPGIGTEHEAFDPNGKLLESFETIGIDLNSCKDKFGNVSISPDEVVQAEMESLGLFDENGELDAHKFQELYYADKSSLDEDTKNTLDAMNYINGNMAMNLRDANGFAYSLDEQKALDAGFDVLTTDGMEAAKEKPGAALDNLIGMSKVFDKDSSVVVPAMDVQRYEMNKLNGLALEGMNEKGAHGYSESVSSDLAHANVATGSRRDVSDLEQNSVATASRDVAVGRGYVPKSHELPSLQSFAESSNLKDRSASAVSINVSDRADVAVSKFGHLLHQSVGSDLAKSSDEADFGD